MAIKLAEDRRQQLVAGVKGFFLQEFDQDLSSFRAEQLLDYFLGALGPQVYNQAVQDARTFMQTHLDDLEGEVYASESF